MKKCVFICIALWLVAFSVHADSPKTADEMAHHMVKSAIDQIDTNEFILGVSTNISMGMQTRIQQKLGHELNDDEKQQLQIFWYEKYRELLPDDKIEDLLVLMLLKTFSLAELQEQYRAGGKTTIPNIKSPSPTAQVAIQEFMNKLVDRAWLLKTKQDLTARFPQWGAILGK